MVSSFVYILNVFTHCYAVFITPFSSLQFTVETKWRSYIVPVWDSLMIIFVWNFVWSLVEFSLSLLGVMNIAAAILLTWCLLLVRFCVVLGCAVWVKKKFPLYGFLNFFPKRLGIFNQFFTHLLCDHFYTRLQIFIQLSLTLTKLCHTKRDHLANFYISLEL